MRHMVNGRVVELRTNPDGSINTDDLWRAAGIPNDRQLILQLPDGGNKIINPGQSLPVTPEQFFMDAPNHRRGCRTLAEFAQGLLGPTARHDDRTGPPPLSTHENSGARRMNNIFLDYLNNRHDPDEDDDDCWEDEDDYSDEDGDYLYQDLKRLSRHFSLLVDDDYQFVVVRGVRLPPGYNCIETGLLVELPADYPSSPPGIGGSHVYASPDLRFCGRGLADLHPSTFPKYATPGFGPWAWLCYQAIAWDPMNDDFIRFIEMVRADLTDPPTT
jgi:hypothetical protein